MNRLGIKMIGGTDPREHFESDAPGSPEKRLLLAVLLNAITHLQRGMTHPAGDEAARWVRGELDAMHATFSFRAICETLDLDADDLARALLGANASVRRLPRRQVRTQRVQGMPRRYRPRQSLAAGE
jgi:hypothetical protein